MFWEDQTAPREQRHTARRLHQWLAAQYGFDSASYSTICDYVQIRRPQIEAEARRGRQHMEGMVPQVHLPGEEAEVDFAEVWVRLAGTAVKCHLFTLRLSYSGTAVHRVFASQAQESFMEGHVEAFRVLGGVPTRHIRYDNLKPAVRTVCTGRQPREGRAAGAVHSGSGRLHRRFHSGRLFSHGRISDWFCPCRRAAFRQQFGSHPAVGAEPLFTATGGTDHRRALVLMVWASPEAGSGPRGTPAQRCSGTAGVSG